MYYVTGNESIVTVQYVFSLFDCISVNIAAGTV